jgi:thioester reductase-like protein
MADAHVVLSGSTGHLGSYILAALIADPKVQSIHCLNRASQAQSRQDAQLADRGLAPLSTTSTPVFFLTTDLTKPRLGLKDEIYDVLAASTTHYIHCAWPVDFNKSFSTFEPSITGLLNLLDLALAGAPHQRPLFLFLSSISAMGNWGAVPGARLQVPEEEVDDWKVARFGYGQSKVVAERLLAEASRVSGLRTAVVRVGQVCGPVEHGESGCWPKQEWLPSLVASAKYLNALPRSLGALDSIDWLPADRVGLMIAELLFCGQEEGTVEFYHLVNPNASSWKALLPEIKAGLGKAHIQTVSLVEWVDLLKESEWDNRNPAVKLLPFFHDLRDKVILVPNARAVTLEVKKTVQKCAVLKVTGAVQPEWVALWFKQWKF